MHATEPSVTQDAAGQRFVCARARPQPARTVGMTEPIALTPIGVVRGSRSQIVEDHWGAP